VEGVCLLGKHQAGNGLLEGGRNSLLESAQEATLTSVATAAFSRQCKSLPRSAWAAHFSRLCAPKTMDLRQFHLSFPQADNSPVADPLNLPKNGEDPGLKALPIHPDRC
jgi:hypothetical protein